MLLRFMKVNVPLYGLLRVYLRGFSTEKSDASNTKLPLF